MQPYIYPCRGGKRQRQKDEWYLRSENLSNLIFVRDIRYAIVSTPISQGKAPKWHDGIHLTNRDKERSVAALQRFKVSNIYDTFR